MSRIDLLAVAKPSPMLAPQLEAAFTVHDRLHETDPAAFAKVAPRIRAITCGGDSRVSAELIAQLPALEIIAVVGVGYDGIDVAAAKARGIAVTNTPEVLNDDVADLAIALMLAWARQIVQADAFVRSGEWERTGPSLGRKVSGARLGIVGIGRIGQGIARRAAAFGMQVAYTARNQRAELPYAYFPSAESLADASDYLIVITPGGEATRGLIGAQVLRALGKKGVLVNVSRGSVVDEPALIESLEKGEIAGAALDVFYDEPKVSERLRRLPNVLLTPHVGSATTSTRQAMADLAVANLSAHFGGQPLPTLVPECRS